MANKLIHETSPYLLQHKNNPVDWLAWNETSLHLSKKLNKPILLSVGYSSCHWCHVMAHESFEDQEIANIMNKNFINIKIDREERPDLDAYYQLCLNLMGQQGGWPLTMFLDTDTKPFWGGTYFPKTARYGLPGFKDILESVFKTFSTSKESIKNNTLLLQDGIKRAFSSKEQTNYSNKDLLGVFNIFQTNMDFVNGGMLGSMKFPQAPVIKTYCAGQKIFSLKENITKTTLCQCMGGIYDHVGGGTSRYTVDEHWLVPHFEKMLYDNANFIDILALQGNNEKYRKYFKNKIDHTVSWLLGEMSFTNQNGIAFYSAIDADSEGIEGKYYVWDVDELKKILGKNIDHAVKEYDVRKEGNWENKNILNRLKFINSNDFELEFSEKNKKILNQIKEQRMKRTPPDTDIKILADWNLMLCSSLIRAYRSFNDEKYLDLSKKILSFFEDRIEALGGFFHNYSDEKAGHPAFLADYACLIRAYILFYEVTFKNVFLSNAIKHTEYVLQKFYNQSKCAFYYNPINKSNINNTAHVFDTATQSGTGTMLENLIQLFNFTNNEKYLNIADECIKKNWAKVVENPLSLSSYVHAANLIINSHHVVVIKGQNKKSDDIEKHLMENLIFNTFEVLANNKDLPLNSPAKNKKALGGLTTAYICNRSSCYEPINNLNDLIKRLKELPFL